MEFHGFTLDKFQEDAAESVKKNLSVVVSAPTGSGKTLIADYIIDRELKGTKRVIYTAPIKALSNQKFKDFTQQYGEDKIGLITGDIVINPQAQILIMTAEVYRNMAIINDPVLQNVSYCIMDEIHYINDEERGYVWEESIIFSSTQVRFLFLSATIPNAQEFADWVGKIKEHQVAVIMHDIRSVPLKIRFFDVDLGITTLDKIKEKAEEDKYPDYNSIHKRQHSRSPNFMHRRRIPPPKYQDLILDLKPLGLFPCIYFVFSRAKTQEYAFEICKKNDFLNRSEKKEMLSLISDFFNKLNKDLHSLRSTKELRNSLSNGVAFHHAGLLPEIKHIVESLFTKGLIKVLFATETFAVGINMPAKCICMDSLRKYTGTGFRFLTSKEFFQISGRAGRRGIDKEGLSVSMVYRPNADFRKIDSFTKKDLLPIKSQFKLSINTVLNMIDLHSNDEINKILRMNFFTFQELKGKDARSVNISIKARYNSIVKKLMNMGYVEIAHNLSDDEMIQLEGSKKSKLKLAKPTMRLTKLGKFASYIFANEIEISQIFEAEFPITFTPYTAILIIAALLFEEKRDTKFYKTFRTKELVKIESAFYNHPFFKKEKWHKNLENLTALIYPCFLGKRFVELLQYSNLPEGDIIRIFMQVLDRLEQIERASENSELKNVIYDSKSLIKNCLDGIHVF
ncbi:DEAD/DEAH box helicase [Candidatus Woesearchaeota archaeon]|jgi:superfamily II RNA helicase|nr:DEAD/DEAH box helicase [Candidatus Woesearchaeota archaeon]